jgi:flagellar hook assembly protein FlgD
VKTLLDNTQQSAGTEQAIPWDGKNGDGDIVANGVYFFTIESSQDERAVGKIAVLR